MYPFKQFIDLGCGLAAWRRRGVEALLEADQVDAAGLEIIDGCEQFPE